MPYRVAKLALTFFLASASMISSVTAQGKGPLWGLTYSNSFSVETTVERTTTVKIGDGPESVHQSTETIVVEYRMAAIQQSEIALRATIASCNRSGESSSQPFGQLAAQQIGICKGLQVYLNLDADGVVTSITQGSATGARVLAGGPGEDSDLLAACWNDRVIGSWLGRPFWCGLKPDEWKQEATWEHTDDVSLGLLGQLRNIVTCTMKEVTDDKAEVLITGNARHIPLTSLNWPEAAPLKLGDVTVSVDQFSGSAKMIRPKKPVALDAQNSRFSPPPSLRPLFDSLLLSWKISGETKIKVGDSERPVVFNQQRKERSRLLPGYQIGQPRMALPEQLFP